MCWKDIFALKGDLGLIMWSLSPGQTDSQADTRLQKQSLSTNMWWVTKQIHKSAHKFTQVTKAVNFMYMQFTCNQLVLTWLGWPNGDKLVTTYVQIWAWPKSLLVNTVGWRKEIQVKYKSKSCVDLQVPLARASNTAYHNIWTRCRSVHSYIEFQSVNDVIILQTFPFEPLNPIMRYTQLL